MEQPLDRPEAADRANTIPRSSRCKSAELPSCYNQQRDDQNQQLRDGKFQDDRSRSTSRTSMDTTEYEDEDEDEEEEEKEQEEVQEREEEDERKFRLEEMRYADARLGICSACHYSVTGKGADPGEYERALLCANGHLLCCRCVQRFAVKSDTNCVLCAAVESQQTSPSISRTSSAPNQLNHRQIHQQQQQRNATASAKRTRGPPRATAPRPRPAPTLPLPCRREPVATERRHHEPGAVSMIHTPNPICYRYRKNHPPRYCNNIDNESSGEDEWNCTERDEDEYQNETEELTKRSENHGKRRSYCSLVQKENGHQLQVQAQMSECSRRPIQCPRQDCAVNVAFSALTNHFVFDHPEVPIISVDPGEKSSFIVNFEGLGYDSSRCLALLLVSGKLSDPAAKQFGGSNVHSRYKNRLPLPILAARLLQSSSSTSREATTNDQFDRDVVIVWVAGLDIGSITGVIRCSIQAIDSIDTEAFRSLTYTGPINSLRTAQKPRDVFVVGDCIILHNGFISRITTSGCKNLNINVTIH